MLPLAPESTYIPLKTAATTAQPLASTTLKPKVQGLNPARDNFLLIILFMCSCLNVGGPKARLYATFPTTCMYGRYTY